MYGFDCFSADCVSPCHVVVTPLTVYININNIITIIERPFYDKVVRLCIYPCSLQLFINLTDFILSC